MNMTRLSKPQRLWSELLALDPSNDVLCRVMINTECLRVHAGKKLLSRVPTKTQLCSIIEYVPVLSVAAGQKLLQQHPTHDELRIIIVYVESLRGEAERRLPKRDLQDVLSDIFGKLGATVQVTG